MVLSEGVMDTGARGALSRPSSLSAVASMYLAFRPASSYCSACVPASKYLSGSTIGRTWGERGGVREVGRGEHGRSGLRTGGMG